MTQTRFSPAQAGSDVPQGQPLRVLCAEDDADIRVILRYALSPKTGCELCLCSSGEELLAQAEHFQSDVVLLDVSMPGMSGPQTLQVLHAMPEMQGVTSILMTAQALPNQLEDLTQQGATGVIVKPFDPLMLAEHLRMYRRLAPVKSPWPR